MNSVPTIENQAALAFNHQAPVFDRIYNNTITDYKRKRVRQLAERFLPGNASILELNAGTGEDALYFAGKGHRVNATDISTGMQDQLKQKIDAHRMRDRVNTELCSFTHLDSLQDPGPYDMIFSNFAGLNCSPDLEKVLASFPFLLNPGGIVVMSILPRFCLWEFLLLFRGKFKTAFRRFSGKKGSPAKIDGHDFRCWYYNPAFVMKHTRSQFDVVALEGLCTLLPPSYIENFDTKHPRWYRWLEKIENRWKASWPWRSIGDYYIIVLRKK